MRAPQDGLQSQCAQIRESLPRGRRRQQLTALRHVRTHEALEHGCGLCATGGEPQSLVDDPDSGSLCDLTPHLPRTARALPRGLAILASYRDETKIAP